MQRIGLLGVLALWIMVGCTNLLYQGEITAHDSYDKERHFILYWTKTEKLIGEPKAGPAILLTECSRSNISFDEQPEGLIFRGMPGFDQLPDKGVSKSQSILCGKVINYAKWTEAKEGPLSIAIYRKPVSDEFAITPRAYLAASPEPYVISVVEKTKRWSFTGETLPAPLPPECRHQ